MVKKRKRAERAPLRYVFVLAIIIILFFLFVFYGGLASPAGQFRGITKSAENVECDQEGQTWEDNFCGPCTYSLDDCAPGGSGSKLVWGDCELKTPENPEPVPGHCTPGQRCEKYGDKWKNSDGSPSKCGIKCTCTEKAKESTVSGN